MAFPVPTNLADHSARYGPDERRAWVAVLPGVVAGLAERWSLTLRAPYEPGGVCSWVAPAVDAAGRDVVLKVTWRHLTEAAHEADGLRVWNGDGAVLLHAAEEFDETTALLLERCVPGTPLGQVLAEPEQDEVVARLLRRLWVEPPAGHPFRPLQQMCDEWATEFEEKLAATPGSIDPGLARAGIELFRSLPATADRSVLLCTDLHGENILARSASRGSSSTPSRTSATRPTTRSSTCSTAWIGSRPTPSAWSAGSPTCWSWTPSG